jgi:ABC-type transport system involved in multi-copper enzyme maturation permease subunit
MSIAWEGKAMRNFLTIAKYEWKMQIKNPGFWVILVFVLIIGGLDSFPTAANMVRLDNQLQNSGYVVSRLLTYVVLMMFGFVFMTANRIRRDRKLGVSELHMASPLAKGQYVAGKFIANLCVVLTVVGVFFVINALVHLVFNPAPLDVLPYFIGFISVAIPMAVFTIGCAVSLSVLTDIRFVYALMAGYFFLNVAIVPDARWLPFYLLAGEPLKLINPYLGFGYKSAALMAYNWLFLLGTGLLALLLLLCGRRYWRER